MKWVTSRCDNQNRGLTFCRPLKRAFVLCVYYPRLTPGAKILSRYALRQWQIEFVARAKLKAGMVELDQSSCVGESNRSERFVCRPYGTSAASQYWPSTEVLG